MLGNSLVAAQLVASYEGLSPIQLVISVVNVFTLIVVVLYIYIYIYINLSISKIPLSLICKSSCSVCTNEKCKWGNCL
jgi:hypothetical protein